MKTKGLVVFSRRRFRHGTVLVLGGVARLGPPVDEDDPTHNRDETEQQPPATFVDVVQTTGTQTQLRQQNGNTPSAGEPNACFTEAAENRSDDEVEQEESPELRTIGSAFKVDIVFQDNALDDGENVVETHFCMDFKG